MSKEQFNPQDYKSHEDLPEDKKGEFSKVEGGFIRKDAADYEQSQRDIQDQINKRDRTVFDKMFGKNKTSHIERMHKEAINTNDYREWKKIDDEKRQKRLEAIKSALDNEIATLNLINDKEGIMEDICEELFNIRHKIVANIVSEEEYEKLLSLPRGIYETQDECGSYYTKSIIGLSKKGIMGVASHSEDKESLREKGFDEDGGVGIIISSGFEAFTPDGTGEVWNSGGKTEYIPNPQKIVSGLTKKNNF